MTSLPPMLLLGLDCLTGLQCARILWRRHVPVIGVAAAPDASYCKTRSVRKIIPADAMTSDPAAVLQEVKSRYAARPVIMACTDEWVWWLNDNREIVGKQADFLMAPSDVLQLLADKARLYRYAIEHRLALPDTRFVRCTENINEAAESMRFPLLLKPPRRGPEWLRATGGFKVVKVDDPATLLRAAPALRDVAGELILQTWVKGPDINMHSLYICMDRQSQPLAHLVVKKIRQWPPDVGVGCLAVETREPAVVELGMSVLNTLGYVGIGSFQCKKDAETGTFYIIEMNTGRPGLNMPLCEICGVDMIATYYCSAAGLPLPESRTIAYPGSKWICWKTDLASAWVHWRRGDLTVRTWLHSLRGRKWSADVQTDDLRPLFTDMTGKLTKRFRQRKTR